VNDAFQITGTMGCVITPCRAFLYDNGTFVNLGVLPGAQWSSASALNRDAQVVGTSDNPYQAFLWQDGVMTGLELPLGPHGVAQDVNDHSQIVGWMGPSASDHGFLWDGGEVVDLGVVPGGLTSKALAINNLPEPQVVGYGRLSDETHAFLWESGEMMDLGTLPGFPISFALDINDSSTVVGYCRPNERAFVWHDGVMTNLNELVPPELGITIKRAAAIDNEGRIIASGTGPDGLVGWLLTPLDPPIGDLDGDCKVGFADLLTLLAGWGPCADCDDCPADLDDDCSVGVADLLALLANWG
jgi:probable HAF family extracellular repeat protein